MSEYLVPISVFQNIAYFLCCVPFKVKILSDGNIKTNQWLPQTALYFLTFVLQLYYRGLSCFLKILHVLEDHGNPIAYFRILEETLYIFQCFAYFQCYMTFQQRYIVIYKQLSVQGYPTTVSWYRKLFLSRPVLMFFMIALITSIAYPPASTAAFEKNINETLATIKTELLFNTHFNMAWKSYTVAVLYIVGVTVVAVKDVIMALDILIAMFVYFLITSNFRKTVFRNDGELSNGNDEKKPLVLFYQCRKTYRLSRSWSRFYGSVVLMYLMDFQVYCALIGIDMMYEFSIFYNASALTIFVTTYFMAGFAAVEMQKVSLKLMEIGYVCHDENKFVLLQHWTAGRAGAIKAKMLPLTFSTLSIFVGYAMLLFLNFISTKHTCKLFY